MKLNETGDVTEIRGTINESNCGLRMAYALMTLAVVWILNVGETAEQTF